MYGKNGLGSLSRREFLRLGGAGLAGMAVLGAAGCGGGGGSDSGDLVFAMGVDSSGTLQDLVDRFNQEHRGEFQVRYREMPADTGQYFDQLRTELQAAASEIDVIGGDVIWPAQFAANGWILDVSDRFSESERQKFLPAPVDSLVYEGAIYGVPWFTDVGMLYYRQDLLEEAGFSEPTRHLGGDEGDCPQGKAGRRHEGRLRLPGRPVRGRHRQRARAHLDARGRRPERR